MSAPTRVTSDFEFEGAELIGYRFLSIIQSVDSILLIHITLVEFGF